MIISHDLFSAMLSYDRKKGLLNYSPDRYVKNVPFTYTSMRFFVSKRFKSVKIEEN